MAETCSSGSDLQAAQQALLHDKGEILRIQFYFDLKSRAQLFILSLESAVPFCLVVVKSRQNDLVIAHRPPRLAARLQWLGLFGNAPAWPHATDHPSSRFQTSKTWPFDDDGAEPPTSLH